MVGRKASIRGIQDDAREIQRFLQILLDIDEIHICLFCSHIFTHAVQEGLKLIATNSLRVTSLSFIEIDNIPNRIEILRVQHSVNRQKTIYDKNSRRLSR